MDFLFYVLHLKALLTCWLILRRLTASFCAMMFSAWRIVSLRNTVSIIYNTLKQFLYNLLLLLLVLVLYNFDLP